MRWKDSRFPYAPIGGKAAGLQETTTSTLNLCQLSQIFEQRGVSFFLILWRFCGFEKCQVDWLYHFFSFFPLFNLITNESCTCTSRRIWCCAVSYRWDKCYALGIASHTVLAVTFSLFCIVDDKHRGGCFWVFRALRRDLRECNEHCRFRSVKFDLSNVIFDAERKGPFPKWSVAYAIDMTWQVFIGFLRQYVVIDQINCGFYINV